ncbi:heterogeneous nuclear ribonucleoprotein L-like isoform X1 [Heptranchias perlo]|uniref:heterogeneous nuclear ribonucleoprotein L-like isoform X1 n=1 Tax=Heptranchias perlo TaxID=212740 RepID=UPI00355973C5
MAGRHQAKRFRFDRDGGAEDHNKILPSAVVHVRGLLDGVVEVDLMEALQDFGNISCVMLMPRRKQALVEFEDIDGACSCVNYAADNPIYVAGQLAYICFSTSQKIARPDDDDSKSNNVLLINIANSIYPINTDVLYTICNPCGPVHRIVIFRKNGIQAMVEFDSVQSAQKAKASLNGADIYSGCCTLKIEYAKPTRLNVFKNDADTWDYVNPNPGRPDPPNKRSRPPALLGDAPSGFGHGYPPSAYHGFYDEDDDYAPPHHYEGRGMGPPPPPPPVGGSRRGPPSRRYTPQYGAPPPPPPPHADYGPLADSPVLIVYGLDTKKMNPDKVFSIFCLYGNVHKVKFLKSKPGAAMVEMGDGFAVDRALTCLNTENFLFDQHINVCVSKQKVIVPGQSFELEDGSCSFKDYSTNRNNRFTNMKQAAKNRIQKPNNMLHFFSAPPAITEEIFYQISDKVDVKKPKSIIFFSGKTGSKGNQAGSKGYQGEKSSSGLLEYESKSDAFEALVMLNHYRLKNPDGPDLFTLKLCFSTA